VNVKAYTKTNSHKISLKEPFYICNRRRWTV